MNTPVVLITGALTGIGRATALAFAEEGARIVVSGRHDDEGQRLVGELGKLGAEAEFVRSDVCHEDDVRSLVDKTVARFGRLDVAVNNAGTEGKPGPVTEQSAESYAATFDTNVLGTLLSMKHELRVMLAQGSGSIINVSSTFGHTGGAGASVYAASKHAVEGLTKSAALGMDRTTLVRNLRPLQRDGFVRAVGGGRGGRVELSITAKGRKKVEEAFPIWQSTQSAVVKTLGERRWSAILTDLETAALALNK